MQRALNELAIILFVPASQLTMKTSANQFAAAQLRFSPSAAHFPNEEMRELHLAIADGIVHLQGCFLRAVSASKRASDCIRLLPRCNEGHGWRSNSSSIARDMMNIVAC